LEAENIKIKPAPKDRKLSPSPFGNRLESAKFAVIRIDRLLVARLLTKHRHCTHPMKGDVKKKILSPPLAGNQGLVTYIQPCLLLRGAFDVAALVRHVVQRRCQPQLMIPT